MAVAKRLYFDLPSGLGRVTASGGKLKLAGDKRTGETADTGPAGPSSEFAYGELSFVVKNQPGVSLVVLGELEGINVFVQDDLGKSWQCRGAFVTDQVELGGGDISVNMEFEGQEEIQ